MIESVKCLEINLTLSRCYCAICKSEVHSFGIKTYFLCNTNFVLRVGSGGGTSWWMDRFKPYAWCSVVTGNRISFPKMFDELPSHVQEKLVFHLDVFVGT